jgi:hypothetical protein
MASLFRLLVNRRRGKNRIPINTKVKVRMTGTEISGLECINICSGGMCLVFDTPPAEESLGTVWLSKDYSNEYIKFEAPFRRIWTKPENPGSKRTMMGIMFRELIPEQRDNLHRILKRESRAHA